MAPALCAANTRSGSALVALNHLVSHAIEARHTRSTQVPSLGIDEDHMPVVPGLGLAQQQVVRLFISSAGRRSITAVRSIT